MSEHLNKLLTELRKAPVKPTGQRILEIGPIKVQEESEVFDAADSPYLEMYRFEARIGAQFALSQAEGDEHRDFHRRRLAKDVAAALFSDIWRRTFEIERLLYERGVRPRTETGEYDIFSELTALRESTGYNL